MITKSAQVADRYVAVWNEPDPDRRRTLIRELWANGGVQVLEAPEAMREGAARYAMSALLEARGHDALEERVTRAYEEFVAPGEFSFRSRGNAARLGDLLKFNWEMVSTNGGDVAAVGLEILELDGDGRIRTDYQFIER